MTNDRRKRWRIQRALAGDADKVLEWVKSESDRGLHSFYCNAGWIRRACEEQRFWVIRQKGYPVAFYLGNYSPEIVCVRNDMRKEGLGTALFKAALGRAIRDNVNILRAECNPFESLSFWQSHGFNQLRENRPDIKRVINRTLSVPSGLPKVPITLAFFPTDKLYPRGADPVATYNEIGHQMPDDTLLLECRLLPARSDAVISIAIDNRELFLGYTKSKDARRLGVMYDEEGGTIYIDRIKPLRNSQ